MRALSDCETHTVKLALGALLDKDDHLKAEGFIPYDPEHRERLDALFADLAAGRGLAVLP